MLASTLALLLAVQAAPSPDSVAAVRARARDAEAAFERLARRLIPTSLDRPIGRPCDEIVGRFCLTYGRTSHTEPAPEAGPVVDARRQAVEALREALAVAPGELDTAAPLVRYLVEDGRAEEAASVARLYASLADDSVWSDLLLGFALHAVGDDGAAEPLLRRGVAALPAEERERFLSLDWLLPREERERWEALSESDRTGYARRFWAWADPLWLTPGNERRGEHLARHVWARMLARAPVVLGMNRWGEDLDQLTVRYGIPVGRTRTWGSLPSEGSLVEHFDSMQLAFDPRALLGTGLPGRPPPGEVWELEEERARSGYAPTAYGPLAPLEHQLSRFPVPGGWEVRVDAVLSLDPAVGPVEAALFLRDTLLATAPAEARARLAVPAGADTLPWTLTVSAPDGALAYSAEALAEGGPAWRARYRLPAPAAAAAVRLSDVLVARPFAPGPVPEGRADPGLRPHTSLVLPRGASVGLYARGPSEGAAVLAVDLDLAPLPPGLHRIVLEVADGAGGTARAERLIRIAEG